MSHLIAYFRAIAKVLLYQCSVAIEKAVEHGVFLYGNYANSFPTRSVVLNFTPLPNTKHSLCLAMTLGCISAGTWNLRAAGTGLRKIPCYSTECHYMVLKLVWFPTSAIYFRHSVHIGTLHIPWHLSDCKISRHFFPAGSLKNSVLLRESFWWQINKKVECGQLVRQI